MKFNDMLVSKEDRFSIGVEENSGKYYLSIPVSNGFVDYEEYYEIDKASFDQYLDNMKSALDFVQQCRNRKMDDRLFINPGGNRGV